MVIRFVGKEMPVRLQHWSNTPLPKCVMALGIVRLVRYKLDSKAASPMLVMLSGRLTLVTLRQVKVHCAMLVTGRPLIELGTATALFVPSYRVIWDAPASSLSRLSLSNSTPISVAGLESRSRVHLRTKPIGSTRDRKSVV